MRMARIALVHDIAGVADEQARILRGAGHEVDHLRLSEFGANWGWLAKALTLPIRLVMDLPAILRPARPAFGTFVRHVPLVLFLVGTPLFMFALADPFKTVTQEQVTYPGRRIALLVDASSSMLKPFGAGRLNARAPTQSVFFTSIGAADAFIRQRQRGNYRDLIALLEFGDEAYVITPWLMSRKAEMNSVAVFGGLLFGGGCGAYPACSWPCRF